MNKALVGVGTQVWSMLPRGFLRQYAWDCFLWWVRGKKKIATVEGITFDLDLGEIIDVCLYVNRFEKEVTNFIDATTKDGFAVLDIGANIGAHCLRFARLVGSKGMVYAFEPTDYAFGKLQKNISLNRFNNILPSRVALSNQSLSQQTISYRSSWRTDRKQIPMSSVVDFVKLDDWAKENAVQRVDIIKIDVDGNEFYVLDGGRKLLDQFKPFVIAEVGAWHFEDPQRNPWAILARLGYSFWDLQNKTEYKTLEQLRNRLPETDPEMGFSINVAASVNGNPWRDG